MLLTVSSKASMSKTYSKRTGRKLKTSSTREERYLSVDQQPWERMFRIYSRSGSETSLSRAIEYSVSTGVEPQLNLKLGNLKL